MRRIEIIILSAVALLVFVLSNAFFVLEPYQKAIVLEFGRPCQELHHPGVFWKVPFLQNVVLYDVRNSPYEVQGEQVITNDKKRLIVDTYVIYRVKDPVLFYKRLHTRREAHARLHALIVSALRGCVGKVNFEDFLTQKRQEIMHAVEAAVRKEMEGYGLALMDLRISRSELPEQNSQAIYRRMVSERQRIAKKVRAEGEEKKGNMCASVKKEVGRIISDAEKESKRIVGSGLKDATAVYASMARKNRRLFQIMRSKKFVDRTLKGKKSKVYLSTGNKDVLTPLRDLLKTNS